MNESPFREAKSLGSQPDRRSSRRSKAEHLSKATFADRLAALVDERRSQVCLGLDPDPAQILGADPGPGAIVSAESAAAVERWCCEVIGLAAPSCIAVKPQLASFERLGPEGGRVLSNVCQIAREAGLLVIADGKRGDVPITARAYGEALFGPHALGADAATLNPILGRDSLQPLIEAAAAVGGGVFVLVRTSNPGAAEFQDIDVEGRPFHERFAGLVAELSAELSGANTTMSGVGAVVGATAPQHLERLRELMPRSTLLLPGIGAQGGDVADLGPAFANSASGGIVTASRSIASDSDPARAADTLRQAVWEVSRT